MALSITHSTVVSTPDDGTSEVGSDEWNAAHTVSGTLDLTTSVTGTLPIGNGGLGLTSGTSGGVLYFSGASALASSAALAANSWVIGGGAGTAPFTAAGISWDDTNRSLTLTGATVTASKPVLDLSQTWNASGTTFTGLKFNVTNTASASGSLLMDLQLGASTVFKVGKSGNVTVTNPAGQATLVLTDGSTGSTSTFQTLSSNRIQSTAATFFAGSICSANTFQLDVSNGDINLERDAANTLAQRRTTNAQTFNLYDTYSSSTDYHRVAIKTARATLSNVSGASVTATGIIPDGAIVVGVTSKVTTGLGTSNGTTGYQIGDGSDVDRWGAITGTAAGTSSDNTNWTATTIQAFTSASNIVVTASGGNFDGTGVIYLSVQYLIGQCD